MSLRPILRSMTAKESWNGEVASFERCPCRVLLLELELELEAGLRANRTGDCK